MADLFFAELAYHPDSSFGKFFTSIGEAPALLPFVYALACIAVYFLKHKNVTRESRNKAVNFFIYTLFALAATALTVSLLKKCWGRVRYVDLSDNAIGFSPWYIPKGLTGHESFPSGHAAMSSLIFFIPDALRYFRDKSSKIINLLCFAFVICVMVARMLMGAHYVSDLLAGAIIAYSVRHATAAVTLNRKFSAKAEVSEKARA